MKAILYDDVPNHTRTFIERAKRGDFNGTLFTRVLPEFMIQGGAPDSKNAPAGAKCGFGDPSAEDVPGQNIILPDDLSMLRCKDADLDHMRKKMIERAALRANGSRPTREDLEFLAQDTNTSVEYVKNVLKEM